MLEISFSLDLAQYQNEHWSENHYLQITPRKNSENLSFIIRVISVKRRGESVTVVCQVDVSKNRSLINEYFGLQSKWSIKLFMNITTQIREYSALAKCETLPLMNQILTPPRHMTRAVSHQQVKTYMKTLDVNQPQAEAISSAIGRESGFVLIQGPPGFIIF